jgi:hypothetical protein
MSKFNRNAVIPNSNKTVNFEGAEAFALDPRTELYVLCSTSLGGGASDKFYRSAKAENKRLVELIDAVVKTDPAFVFQLAAYCRKDMYLRSIPTVLFVEGIRAMYRAKKANSNYPVNAVQFANYIFGRPDEITEALAYWKFVTNDANKLPIQLRKGLQVALNSFNEYSLVKYDQDNKEVKFRDVLRRVHPEPKNAAQAALFNYLIRDVLNEELMPQTAAREKLLKLKDFNDEAKALIRESHATWETVVSKFGSTKEVWEFVLPNMGYMATLRNLNNFIKNGIDVEPVIATLTNPEEVAKSKQLPFRFLSAFKALDQNDSAKVSSYYRGVSALDGWKVKPGSQDTKKRLRSALGTALNLSVVNIPKFPGRTLCSADTSGSMLSPINDKSTMTCLEIASVMTALAGNISEEGICTAFAQTFAVVPQKENLLETATAISTANVGHSTNAYLILDYLIKNKILVNRVMYFTDTQCYGSYGNQSMNSLWNTYTAFVQKETGEKPYIYEVNLNGYGTSNFDRQNNVAKIAGWSDKIFDLMSSFESDPRGAVAKIKEKYPINELARA